MTRFVWCWLMLLAGIASISAQPRLWITPGTNDFLRIKSSTNAGSAVILESTTNFTSWQRAGHTLDSFRNFPLSANEAGGFYRLRVQPATATNDWKNELLFAEDPLRSPDDQEIRWVKFLILRNDPTRIYFQDSSKFPFHFNFASQRLGQFQKMTTDEFDAVTLHRTNQQAVLGSILLPRDPSFVEYGVQFVGRDAYTPQEIGEWFRLVKASVFATNGAIALYIPVFEQSAMARTNSAAFEAQGVPIGSIERWVPFNHVYSEGWALGALKFFSAGEIPAAFGDGRLQPRDILITDGVPAETPLVAGIISLTPSTPNSHTAILAQSFGIPFVYLPEAAEQARVQGLVGRTVMLRADGGFWSSQVRVVDMEGQISLALETEILTLKKPSPIQYQPKQTFGALLASTENLTPNDIKYFGGKAANYGMLRDYVPTNSPPAIAFSFDLWDSFMDQILPGGLTLRATVAARLANYTNYPPDIPALKADLAAIRDLIRQNASFSPAQKQAITNSLSIFNPERKIRFRSSTNVEDSENFTGAGLYDSYSGCLLDDLDADTVGPSICDPSENNERGVFRALQRVYASFYNDNAFLERLRHGVRESEVGMAVLVHHSFPDEEELANGVATLRVSFSSFSTNMNGTMVTQLGANSVSNPDGSSIPEAVEASRYGDSTFFSLSRRSSLVPLGDYVMKWESEYRGMFDLLAKISLGFHQVYPAREGFFLDFEYKKDLNLGLVVKQVRQIPEPSATDTITGFLLNEPTTYCVFQGEQGDVFANHRLKSIWNFNTVSVRLTPQNLAQGLYGDVSLAFVSNAVPQSISGPFSAWPNAAQSADGTTNTWTTGSSADQWRWSLNTWLNPDVLMIDALRTQRDYKKLLSVTYPRPVPTMDYDGTLIMTTNEIVYLEPCPQIGPGAIRREYAFTNKNGAKIETIFYWPRPPTGVVAGYTAPLVQFVQTTITGLTTQPIMLQDYYSQTYHPFHHNFSEEFLFEPRLDPNVPAATVQELGAAGIQMIYARRGELGAILKAISPTGAFRDL